MVELAGVSVDDALRLFEDSPDIVALLERAPGSPTRVGFANAVVRRSAGWSQDEIRGRSLHDLLPADVVDQVEVEFTTAVDSGRALTFEVTTEVPRGRRTYQVTLIPISPDGDVQRVFDIARDLTHERQAAAALREVEEIAHVGVWSWDMVDDVVIWSDELYRIYGVEPGEFPATYEAYLERIHPDDRDNISDLVSRAAQEGEGYEVEHRIVLPDGEVRLIASRARVFYGVTGDPIRLGGTAQDITERRAAEDVARRVEAAEAKGAQALELNDNVIQGLSVARLALMQEQYESALSAVDRTLEAARALVSELLEDRTRDYPLAPGDLVRERHAHVVGEAEA